MPVTAEDIKVEELRLRYLELLERPEVFPTRANWEFISSHRMRGLGHVLYHKYLVALTIGDNDREELHDITIEEFPKYIKSIDREEALDAIFSDLSTVPEASLELIRECELFDANYLINQLDCEELAVVMDLLDVYQPSYDEADLEAMKELLDRLETLPATGGVTQVNGLFGSSMKYVCPAGHKNTPEAEYCSHPGCGLNCRGLKKADVMKIELFRRRIQALENLLMSPSTEDKF